MNFSPLEMAMTALVHLPFLVNGYQQVAQDWSVRFKKWNMPARMSYVLVPAQLLCNGLLWLPRYRLLGAMGLGLILMAAIMTLTRYYEPRRAYYLPALGLLLLVMWGATTLG
jgi:hypothetical protein